MSMCTVKPDGNVKCRMEPYKKKNYDLKIDYEWKFTNDNNNLKMSELPKLKSNNDWLKNYMKTFPDDEVIGE